MAYEIQNEKTDKILYVLVHSEYDKHNGSYALNKNQYKWYYLKWQVLIDFGVNKLFPNISIHNGITNMNYYYSEESPSPSPSP